MDKFDKRNVELLPDEMEMLSATELTQYYIQSWSLEFHVNGTVNRKLCFYALQKCLIIYEVMKYVLQGHHQMV